MVNCTSNQVISGVLRFNGVPLVCLQPNDDQWSFPPSTNVGLRVTRLVFIANPYQVFVLCSFLSCWKDQRFREYAIFKLKQLWLERHTLHRLVHSCHQPSFRPQITMIICHSLSYLDCEHLTRFVNYWWINWGSGVVSVLFLWLVDMDKSRIECDEFVLAETKREAFVLDGI
jgi:hypothetical protein